MLTIDINEIKKSASQLGKHLKKIGDSRLKVSIAAFSSKAGGGALPLLELPSKCLMIQIEGMSVNTLERYMREHAPPIIGRIEDDAFIIDPRTLLEDDLPIIGSAFGSILKRA
jgi:L-seryl-tRNA(Ser) seleniumtransferase